MGESIPVPSSTLPPLASSSALFPWNSSSGSSVSRSLEQGDTIALVEVDVWQRCLELKNLLGLPAKQDKIRKSGLFRSREVQQNYVNVISLIEAKKHKNGLISNMDAELVRQALQMMFALRISTLEGEVINHADIDKLCSESVNLSRPGDKQTEHYRELMVIRSKLNYLLEQMRPYAKKSPVLFNNIDALATTISDKISEYQIQYHSSIQSSCAIPAIQPLPQGLSAEEALKTLMHRLRMQFYDFLPPSNKNTHVFTPDYTRVGDKFESSYFSPYSREDVTATSALTLLSADKIDISRLRAEVNMLGLPATVERAGIHRFKHENSTVGAVRIVIDCADPVIFNIATEFQRIRHQYDSKSVTAHIAREEPSVMRSSMLSFGSAT